MSRPTVIASAALVALAFVSLGAAKIRDDRREGTIARGVVIGGVQVGGLTARAARAELARSLLEPLRRPVVLTHGRQSWRLTAREARTSMDLEASVRTAIARSRTGNFLSRTLRDLRGQEIELSITPRVRYSDTAIVRLIDRARKDLEREPVNATLAFSGASPVPVASRDGRRVLATGLHKNLRRVIVSPTAERELHIRVKRVRPEVTTRDLGSENRTVVVVQRDRFRLTLFKNLKPIKSYRIAVGQAGLETPAGLYRIQNKRVNPSWHVPNSDWAGDLAGTVVPPGPDNPIKARWMGIADGAGIHGTSSVASLGSAASHGCVRMAVKDVIDLYDQVPVGTPIFIS